MIIVTGGLGFIGSNIVRKLNELNEENIIIVDNLKKFKNKYRYPLKFKELIDKKVFIEKIKKNKIKNIKQIYHQGACSDTTNWDYDYLINNNFEYSKELLHYCSNNKIKFIYASSAAVYGLSKKISKENINEKPINLYAFSKLIFDKYVNLHINKISNSVVGLRYFNVYGNNEFHKNHMSSVILKFDNQIKKNGKIKLFKGNDGYKDGEQKRDFIHVNDCVNVNLWFMKKNIKGIYNVGTSISSSFNKVANIVIKYHKKGKINYINFPSKLKNSYQSFTKADLKNLRDVGYKNNFISLREGIFNYLDYLNNDQ